MTFQNRREYRALFTQQMQLSDSDLELDRATLYVAGEDYLEVDVAQNLTRIEEIADQIRSSLDEAADQQTIADALNHYLFQQLGFSGNPEDYYEEPHTNHVRPYDHGRQAMHPRDARNSRHAGRVVGCRAFH